MSDPFDTKNLINKIGRVVNCGENPDNIKWPKKVGVVLPQSFSTKISSIPINIHCSPYIDEDEFYVMDSDTLEKMIEAEKEYEKSILGK